MARLGPAEKTEESPQTPIAPQIRVTKNPRKVADGRKGALARKAKLIHNIENSRLIKTWASYALGVVAIAVVWLFYKTGEEKTSQVQKLDEVQLELSPHVML